MRLNPAQTTTASAERTRAACSSVRSGGAAPHANRTAGDPWLSYLTSTATECLEPDSSWTSAKRASLGLDQLSMMFLPSSWTLTLPWFWTMKMYLPPEGTRIAPLQRAQ